jgi:hypothetical protein
VIAEIRPDMSCVPYRRRKRYFLLTVPLLVLLIGVFVYLWTFSFILSLVFVLFYLMMSYFQAYCCVYQDCPYVGEFCPAVMGILPANFFARLIYGRKGIVKSKKVFDVHASLAIAGWLGLIVFPVFWIATLGVGFVVGYIVVHVVYAAVFGFTICPVCAIRDTCPGGKFHGLVSKLLVRQS